MAACSVMTETADVETPINPAKPWLINRSTASELGRKGVEARKAYKIALAQEHERLKQTVDALLPVTVKVNVQASDDYQSRTLARTREELDATFEMLKGETDPGNRTKLAQAIEKLGELERRLANRPMPPTIKGNAAPVKRRQTFAEPIPLSEPGPQVQEAKTCDPFSEVELPSQ